MKLFGFKLGLLESLITGIIILVIVWVLYRQAAKAIGKAKREKEMRDIEESILPANLSFDEETYKNYADILHKAMARMGTDEAAIYNVFRKLNNRDDLMKLTLAFGERQQPHNPGAFLADTTPMNLAEFLNDELDEAELKVLNQIIWDKGIKIQYS